MTTRLPGAYCPSCEKLCDAASNLDDDNSVPKPGDYCVCIYCAALLLFNEHLKLVAMTPEEYIDLPDDDRIELARMRKAIIQLLEQTDGERKR